MPAASFRSQSADSLDTAQRAWSAAGQGLFTSRDDVPPGKAGVAAPSVRRPVLGGARAVFCFFSGMPAASFRSQIADPLDIVQRAWSAAGQGLFTPRDRVSLRADLRQSQSGNSSLSPGACRARSTTAELAVWEIGPITSAHAPRDYGGRSLEGAKVLMPKVAGQIGGLRCLRSRCGLFSKG